MAMGASELQITVVDTLAEMARVQAAVVAGPSPRRGVLILHASTGALMMVSGVPGSATPLAAQLGLDITSFVTAANLSADINKFVRLNAGTRKVELCAAAGERPLGVLTYVESAAADSLCVVRAFGVCNLINLGGCTKGDLFATTAAGLGDPTPAATAVAGAAVNGGFVAGMALEDKATGVAGLAFISTIGLLPTNFI